MIVVIVYGIEYCALDLDKVVVRMATIFLQFERKKERESEMAAYAALLTLMYL